MDTITAFQRTEMKSQKDIQRTVRRIEELVAQLKTEVLEDRPIDRAVPTPESVSMIPDWP